MPGITAQVRFQHITDLPEDVVVNTLHFAGDPATVDGFAMAVAVEEFYTALHGTQVTPLSGYLSPVLSRTAPAQVRLYDTSTNGASGPPFATKDFALTAATGSGLPAEVAAVMSFYSGAASNVATARGRVYLGPLCTTVLTAPANEGVRLTQQFMTDCVEAMKWLEDATVTHPWATRSADLAAVTFRDVDGGFVDSAFDTQRRRGEQSVTRVSWHV